MSDINQALADAVRASISEGLDEKAVARAAKQIRDLSYELETDLQYAMVERLADHLTGYVEEMAKKVVKALLDGNENEMRRYLSCAVHGFTGRSDWSSVYVRPTPIEDQHPVIHGRLHEHSQLATRRAIVDAHRDLIANQRILDLEDQVKSLVAQVNAKTAQIEQLHERLRS